MRLIPSKPWIKSNTLPFDDAAPIFSFEALAWLMQTCLCEKWPVYELTKVRSLALFKGRLVKQSG